MPGFCRILIEFEKSHVRLYLCNASGKIIDEEVFALKSNDTPEEARDRAMIVHALAYDSLNYGINSGLQAVTPKCEDGSSGRNYHTSLNKPGAQTVSSEENYEGIPIWDQLRLLSEWSPLIGFGQRFVGEPDPVKKTIIVADACEWLATKTRATTVDDELVSLLSAILKSPQGEALVRWGLAKANGGK